MRVETVAVWDYRNLAEAEISLGPGFTVLWGHNGAGKTNLLEAIYLVSTLRSFRTSSLSDLVAFGQPQTKLGARVVKDDMVRVYEVELAPGSRKVRLDGKAPRPLARYFGAFNVVVFTPEDLALPRGSPGDRRRFLDRGVFNLQPEYLTVASDYEKVLKTRNSVLKQVGAGTLSARHAEDMLAVYDDQLARLSGAIGKRSRGRAAASASSCSLKRTGRGTSRWSRRGETRPHSTPATRWRSARSWSHWPRFASATTTSGPTSR